MLTLSPPSLKTLLAETDRHQYLRRLQVSGSHLMIILTVRTCRESCDSTPSTRLVPWIANETTVVLKSPESRSACTLLTSNAGA